MRTFFYSFICIITPSLVASIDAKHAQEHVVSSSIATKNNSLRIAIARNSPENFVRALTQGANPNGRNCNGKKPIIWFALCSPNPMFLQLLFARAGLDQSAKVDVSVNVMFSHKKKDPLLAKHHPLLWWIMRFVRHPQVLQYTKSLISAGANVNALDGYGVPLAFSAIDRVDADFLKIFLESGRLNRDIRTHYKGKSCSL